MKYFKEVNKIFKYSTIIKNSSIFAFLIIVIDYLNIPTQFIEKDMFLSHAVFSFLMLLIIFDFIIAKQYCLVKAKSINVFDKNIFTLYDMPVIQPKSEDYPLTI